MSDVTKLSNEVILQNQGGVPFSGTQKMGKDEFLKILMTEMKYQDPTNPMDNKESIAQLAQFSALEQMQQLSKLQENMMHEATVSQAISLIGKNVEALDPETGKTFTDKVTAMKMVDGLPKLIMGTKEVDLGLVSKVTL